MMMLGTFLEFGMKRTSHRDACQVEMVQHTKEKQENEPFGKGM